MGSGWPTNESNVMRMVLLVLCLLLMVVHLRRLPLRQALDHGRQLFARLRKGGCHAPCDKLHAEIRVKTRQWQTEQFRRSFLVLSLLYFNAALLFASASLTKGAPAEYAGFVASVLAGYACVLLLMSFPRLLSSRTVDAWFALLATLAVLGKSPAVGRLQSPLALSLPSLLLGALQLARLDSRSAAASGLLSCLATASFGLVGAPAELAAHVDVATNVSAALACWLAERWARRHVQAGLESEGVQHAFRALLRNFYEVVLELDEELRTAGPATDLAAFLLYGPGTQLNGRSFQDFVREEDRSSVLEVLRRQPRRQCSMAEVVHAQMRGVDGSALEAELFFFGFEGLGRYVVGIREYGDEMHGVPKKQQHRGGGSGDPEELSVTVDTSGAGFPSLRPSPAFEAVMGPMPQGACLLPRLSNWEEFSAWVQAKMNAQLTNQPPPEGHQFAFQVKFKAQAGVQTRATCKMLLADILGSQEQLYDSDDSEDHSPLLAKLVFSEVQRCRCRHRHGSASARSGSSGSLGSSSRSCSGSSSAGSHHRPGPQRSRSPVMAKL